MVKFVFSKIVIFFVLIPIYPFYILHHLGLWLVAFVDWCIQDRKWSNSLADKVEKIADWGEDIH